MMLATLPRPYWLGKRTRQAQPRDPTEEKRSEGAHRYRSWSRQFSVVELRDQSFSLYSRALSSIIAGPPETRKQPHRYRSWSRQFSVVELRDQSFSLHSLALSSIIAGPPETRKQPHRYKSWSRQFSVVELHDQSFSLHSLALSSIIAGPPETRKQSHRYRSWSRQFSVVELRDQSFSLHSLALSSIIAAPRRENSRTDTGHGAGNFPSWSSVTNRSCFTLKASHSSTFQHNWSPETRKQPHRYRSWSRQFSVVELHDQSFSVHSLALSSIIAALSSIIAAPRRENSRTDTGHGAGNFPSWSSVTNSPRRENSRTYQYRSWSRQFSVVELRDQSFSLHSRALSSIIAAPRRENSRTDTGYGAGNFPSWSSVTNRSRFTPGNFPAKSQPHRYRSWSRQFSVVELRDQSFSLHSRALFSIIAPHRYRSWSRQFSVVELRDQSFSLHSQELSIIIAALRRKNRYRSWSMQFLVVELRDQSFSLHSRALSSIIAGTLRHNRRSWSRQFSVVELRDQSFLLHSQALCSIIAAPRRENRYRSWSRKYSVVELRDQSFSLHSQALLSIIASPTFQHNCRSWSRQFSVVELHDQSFSLHSRALSSIIKELSSIIAAPRRENRYRSWSRQYSVVELRDQSFSLHSRALLSIIADAKKQPHMSWSRQFFVVEIRNQSFSLHSRALSSIIAAPRRENSCTSTAREAGNFPSWSSMTNPPRRENRYKSWSRQFSVVELRDHPFSLHSRELSGIIVAPRCENIRTGTGDEVCNFPSWSSMTNPPRRENNRTGTGHGADNFPSWSSVTNRVCGPETRKQPQWYKSWSRRFSVVELRDQSFSLYSRALSSIIAAPRRENNRTTIGSEVGNIPSWSSVTNRVCSPETRKQPHWYRSWSRQFSVVGLRDQSFSLHSLALSSIIAAPRCENSRTGTGHGAGNFPSWSSVTNPPRRENSRTGTGHEVGNFLLLSSTRKQPHRYRSWSRQFSVVELRDRSFSLHSRALSSIIADPPETRKQPHWYRSWSRQFSVVKLHDQSFFFSLPSTFQHNCSPETRKQPHRYRSWSRQFSVVELHDQSFSLHFLALSSIIAGHGAGNFPSWSSVTNRSRFILGHFPALSPETRKQPHWYRSWSRQFSVTELRDQSSSLHSRALSSIIAEGTTPSDWLYDPFNNQERCSSSSTSQGFGESPSVVRRLSMTKKEEMTTVNNDASASSNITIESSIPSIRDRKRDKDGVVEPGRILAGQTSMLPRPRARSSGLRKESSPDPPALSPGDSTPGSKPSAIPKPPKNMRTRVLQPGVSLIPLPSRIPRLTRRDLPTASREGLVREEKKTTASKASSAEATQRSYKYLPGRSVQPSTSSAMYGDESRSHQRTSDPRSTETLLREIQPFSTDPASCPPMTRQRPSKSSPPDLKRQVSTIKHILQPEKFSNDHPTTMPEIISDNQRTASSEGLHTSYIPTSPPALHSNDFFFEYSEDYASMGEDSASAWLFSPSLSALPSPETSPSRTPHSCYGDQSSFVETNMWSNIPTSHTPRGADLENSIEQECLPLEAGRLPSVDRVLRKPVDDQSGIPDAIETDAEAEHKAEEESLDILGVQSTAPQGSDYSENIEPGDKQPSNDSLADEEGQLQLVSARGVRRSETGELHETFQPTSLSTLFDAASDCTAGDVMTCDSPLRLAAVHEAEFSNQKQGACLSDMVLNDVDAPKPPCIDDKSPADGLLASQAEDSYEPAFAVTACQTFDPEEDGIKENGQLHSPAHVTAGSDSELFPLSKTADIVKPFEESTESDTAFPESGQLIKSLLQNSTAKQTPGDHNDDVLNIPLGDQQLGKPDVDAVGEPVQHAMSMMSTVSEPECPGTSVSPWVHSTTSKDVEPSGLIRRLQVACPRVKMNVSVHKPKSEVMADHLIGTNESVIQGNSNLSETSAETDNILQVRGTKRSDCLGLEGHHLDEPNESTGGDVYAKRLKTTVISRSNARGGSLQPTCRMSLDEWLGSGSRSDIKDLVEGQHLEQQTVHLDGKSDADQDKLIGVPVSPNAESASPGLRVSGPQIVNSNDSSSQNQVPLKLDGTNLEEIREEALEPPSMPAMVASAVPLDLPCHKSATAQLPVDGERAANDLPAQMCNQPKSIPLSSEAVRCRRSENDPVGPHAEILAGAGSALTSEIVAENVAGSSITAIENEQDGLVKPTNTGESSSGPLHQGIVDSTSEGSKKGRKGKGSRALQRPDRYSAGSKTCGCSIM
ncbi:unnamed protein product [Closterium sp. Yama58-4]|nr:unnamed protein product [Closterium sp. Yama58-4]